MRFWEQTLMSAPAARTAACAASLTAGPILANGTLYLTPGKGLVAVRDAGSLGTPEQADPVLRGRAPDALFVPTPEDVVSRMLGLAHPGPEDTFYDLGSGDG